MQTIFFITLLVVVLAVATTTIYALVSGIGWVPTHQQSIKRFLQLVDLKPGQLVYDLGCGDGRLVIAASQQGAKAIGLEISILPYLVAQLRRLLSKSRAQIKFRDFWSVDLSQADVVYFFLIPRVYRRLKNKLAKELKPGAKVVALSWPIEGWTATVIDKPRSQRAMYLYIR